MLSFSLVAGAAHVCPAGIAFTSTVPTGTANGTVARPYARPPCNDDVPKQSESFPPSRKTGRPQSLDELGLMQKSVFPATFATLTRRTRPSPVDGSAHPGGGNGSYVRVVSPAMA